MKNEGWKWNVNKSKSKGYLESSRGQTDRETHEMRYVLYGYMEMKTGGQTDGQRQTFPY